MLLKLGIIFKLLKFHSAFTDYIRQKSFFRHGVFDGHKDFVCLSTTGQDSISTGQHKIVPTIEIGGNPTKDLIRHLSFKIIGLVK